MRPWTALILVGLAELLGMSLWFPASAISTELQTFWELDSTQGVLLTTFVQIGFVAGTAFAAVLNLADILPTRWYFAGSAALGAAVHAALLVEPGFKSALALRFSTGFLLAGVYPPAMKMVATWFRAGRGLAIGVVVGALTVGMAPPYLIRALGGACFQAVILVSTSCALLGAAKSMDPPSRQFWSMPRNTDWQPAWFPTVSSPMPRPLLATRTAMSVTNGAKSSPKSPILVSVTELMWSLGPAASAS